MARRSVPLGQDRSYPASERVPIQWVVPRARRRGRRHGMVERIVCCGRSGSDPAPPSQTGSFATSIEAPCIEAPQSALAIDGMLCLVFERFTERARHVLVLAQEEARALQYNYVGTEHILLGLLGEEEGLAAHVLDSLGITLERARAQVVRTAAPSNEVTTGQIPFTPRVERVLELALREALALGHDAIGTEHLLLGLVRDDEGVAMRVLLDFDANPEKIRAEVIRQLPRSEGHERGRTSATVRMIELTFRVSPDHELEQLLMAAAGRALADQRAEFGLADLLSVAKDNERASDGGDTDPPQPA